MGKKTTMTTDEIIAALKSSGNFDEQYLDMNYAALASQPGAIEEIIKQGGVMLGQDEGNDWEYTVPAEGIPDNTVPASDNGQSLLNDALNNAAAGNTLTQDEIDALEEAGYLTTPGGGAVSQTLPGPVPGSLDEAVNALTSGTPLSDDQIAMLLNAGYVMTVDSGRVGHLAYGPTVEQVGGIGQGFFNKLGQAIGSSGAVSGGAGSGGGGGAPKSNVPATAAATVPGASSSISPLVWIGAGVLGLLILS